MAELSVSRKSIAELLSFNDSQSRGKQYIIPEYQRPYRWDVEKCETLWTDLANFYEECKLNDNTNAEYFLGTIVTCVDDTDKMKINVIDGQQRITSLYLLLRAFYTKLEELKVSNPNDPKISGLMSSLEPCIWNVDWITKQVIDKNNIHIHSLVASASDNDVFHSILALGQRPKPIKFQARQPVYATNYETNYIFFLDKYNEFINDHPMDWHGFCACIITRCIVLPIECVNLDSALTIFGTLNDRGLPLSDSDIFKSELYKLFSSPLEKETFTTEWTSIEDSLTSVNLSVDDIFRYYTHVIRGNQQDESKEIGLRRFYAGRDNKYKLFENPNFFKDIKELTYFWIDIHSTDFDAQTSYCSVDARKYIQCLLAYPNDYWRYALTVFFIKHRYDNDFKNQVAIFLRRLTAFMFARFIQKPTVNAVKSHVFHSCVEIAQNGNATLKMDIPEQFEDVVSSFGQSKMTKALLILNAYLFEGQKNLLPRVLDIEHIFPQKWQNTNYNGWNQVEAQVHLNMLGNKVVLEKKLNIQAGNGYFGQKKIRYSQSAIAEVQGLANFPSQDWQKEDIERRNEVVVKRLCDFFRENLMNKYL